MPAASSGSNADDWLKPRGGSRAAPGAARPTSRTPVVAAFLFLGLLGILAGIAAFVLRSEPKPLFFAVSISEYDAVEWPANPYAKQSADRLRELFDKESTQAFQDQEKNRFTASIAQALRQERSPIVLYLCTYGIPWDDTVYLIPGNADPSETTSWIALDDVLKPIRNHRDKVFLILDIRPVRSSLILSNGKDVAGELERALLAKEQRGELPFPVLNAGHGPLGPLPVPSRGTTWFNLRLVEGLRGKADGSGSTGKQDKIIGVRELSDFTIDGMNGVPPAAARCRLHGTFEDFPLLNVSPSATPEVEAAPVAAAEADRRQPLYDFRDSGAAYRFPRLDRLARWTLGRAEQQRFTGADTRDADEQAKRAATLLKSVPAPIRPPPTSMAVQVQTPEADEVKRRAAIDAVGSLLDMIRAGAKPEDFKGALAAFQAKWKAGLSRSAIDEELLGFLDRLEEPTQDHFRQLEQILQAMRPGRSAVETATIELLAAAPVNFQGRRWPKGMAKEIAKTASSAEAACAVEAAALPWIEKQIAELDRERRELMLRLFDRDRPDDDYARTADGNSTLRKLVLIRTDYQACRQIGDVVAEAQREARVARVVLSDLNDDAYARIGPNAKAVQRCVQQLVDALIDVQAGLREPAVAFDMDRWKTRTLLIRDLRKQLQDLHTVPANATYLEATALLRCEVWSARQRAELKAAATAWERSIVDGLSAAKPRAAELPQLAEATAVALPWSLLHAVERARSAGRAGAEERYRDMQRSSATPASIQTWSKATSEDFRKLIQEYRATADLKLRAELGWLLPAERLPAWPRGNPNEPEPNAEHAEAARLELEASRGFRRMRHRAEAETFRAVAESTDRPQPFWKSYIEGHRQAAEFCDTFQP